MVKAIDTAAEHADLVDDAATIAATLPLDPTGSLFAAMMASHIAAAETALYATINATIHAQLARFFPGVLATPEFEALATLLARLFTVVVTAAVTAVSIGVQMADTADNEARRQRFVQYITPGNVLKYPRVVPFDNGQLILLDSM